MGSFHRFPPGGRRRGFDGLICDGVLLQPDEAEWIALLRELEPPERSLMLELTRSLRPG